MIKRLGNLAAACALTALPALSLFTPGAANAAPLTATKNFDVSATVSAIATITFDRTSFTWGSSDFTSYGGGFVGADNNPGTIGGTFRTSNTGGGGSIYFSAPASIPGANGGTLTVANVMKFTCTGSYQSNHADGSLASAVTFTGGTSSQAAVSSSSDNACATLPVNTSAGSISVPLNLFLNGDSLAADTYNTTNAGGTPFTITISAT